MADLARAVRAKVHENQCITILYPDGGSAIWMHTRGFDKFVIFAAVIGCQESIHRIGGAVLGIAIDHEVISGLQPVPAFVSIEGKKTSYD